MKKTTVVVETEKDEKGRPKPLSVILPDGRYYPVEKTLHYAVSPGEYEGIRYTVIIGKSERHLYLSGETWYVMG